MKFFNCFYNALDSSFVLKTTGTFPMSHVISDCHVFEVKFIGKVCSEQKIRSILG